FDEEGGGTFIDTVLLNCLVREKLQAVGHDVLAEGWRWLIVEPEYDYQLTAGVRHLHPVIRELSPQQRAAVRSLEAEYDTLFEEASLLQGGGEPTGEIAKRLEITEGAIQLITGGEEYLPEDKAIAGAIVSLGHDGEARIERGFVRKEDDRDPERRSANGEADTEQGSEADSGPAPLSDKLVAELTAHRTAALRVELAQHPETALIALTHPLASVTFSLPAEGVLCLQIAPRSVSLSGAAPGIDETPAMRALDERHEGWRARLPEEPEQLWGFVAALDP